ncbi:MAG: formylglycine-generating enzyme family protein [Magnetococcales bacterium]|nr:formylglycine-generating enzyme family protein [Magnetococcales bacterium]
MPPARNLALLALAVVLGGTILWVRASREPPPTATDPTGDSHRKTWWEPATGMEFVWVTGGCCEMGSPESEAKRDPDETRHQVCVTDLWVGRHEVTNGQYRLWKPSHSSGERSGQSLDQDDQPVVEVSWDEATAYAQWLSKSGHGTFRLLTEAEWEYAARGGTTDSRYWGDDEEEACRYANVFNPTSQKGYAWPWDDYYCADGFMVTAPVGRFIANPFGLHDMLGNVLEWTCSSYESSYNGAETRCADGGGPRRAARGGSWHILPSYVRAANRYWSAPNYHRNLLGFRLARLPRGNKQ